MQEMEFNLLEEPWIRVRKTQRSTVLTDALLRSHEYADLAGELPTRMWQSFGCCWQCCKRSSIVWTWRAGMLRCRRRTTLWNAGACCGERRRLPEKPIREYLDAWRDRFWLFHPERPFYQVNEAQIGTEYGAKKLNGEISESENKYRLFQSYAGRKKDSLTYRQAARWLLYLNGFDDTSSKPKGKNLPSVGAGWLGKLGLLLAQGKTLAETLLLNLTLLKDGRELWDPPHPYWESDQPRTGGTYGDSSAKRSGGPFDAAIAQTDPASGRRGCQRVQAFGGRFLPEGKRFLRTDDPLAQIPGKEERSHRVFPCAP